MLKTFAVDIIQTLRQRGFLAYLAGGCVRDLLLKREPSDFDVATSATPSQVMEIFPDTYAVGVQFGVVLVPLPEHRRTSGDEGALPKTQAVEVATFRSDLGYTDGRRPDEVRFSQDPREDVARRDFTINGMMLDPVSGEVLDFVGGRRDLEAGIIRTIGDPELRFAEDKLRMLRAVRFSARFGYVIEPQTLVAIQRLAHEIQVVSRERVRDELAHAEAPAAVRAWIAAPPPDHFLLVEPDPDAREILLTEIRQSTNWPATGISLEQASDPRVIAGAVPLCRPSKTKAVRALLPMGVELITLQIRSANKWLDPELPALKGQLIGVVSNWIDFREIAQTMLGAAGVDPELLVMRNPKRPRWQRGLEQTGAVICDALTATTRPMPKGPRIFVFSVLADAARVELRQLSEASQML